MLTGAILRGGEQVSKILATSAQSWEQARAILLGGDHISKILDISQKALGSPSRTWWRAGRENFPDLTEGV
jgi:hypothetical protein